MVLSTTPYLLTASDTFMPFLMASSTACLISALTYLPIWFDYGCKRECVSSVWGPAQLEIFPAGLETEAIA